MQNQQAGSTPLAEPQTPIESAVKDLARVQQDVHIAVEQLARRLAPVLAETRHASTSPCSSRRQEGRVCRRSTARTFYMRSR